VQTLSLSLAAGVSSPSWAADYSPLDVQQMSLPSHSPALHTEPQHSTGDVSWPAAVSSVETYSASNPAELSRDVTDNGIVATRIASSLVGVYPGDGRSLRPHFVMMVMLLFMGVLFGEF
jgi:hypothetical protein